MKTHVTLLLVLLSVCSLACARITLVQPYQNVAELVPKEKPFIIRYPCTSLFSAEQCSKDKDFYGRNPSEATDMLECLDEFLDDPSIYQIAGQPDKRSLLIDPLYYIHRRPTAITCYYKDNGTKGPRCWNKDFNECYEIIRITDDVLRRKPYNPRDKDLILLKLDLASNSSIGMAEYIQRRYEFWDIKVQLVHEEIEGLKIAIKTATGVHRELYSTFTDIDLAVQSIQYALQNSIRVGSKNQFVDPKNLPKARYVFHYYSDYKAKAKNSKSSIEVINLLSKAYEKQFVRVFLPGGVDRISEAFTSIGNVTKDDVLAYAQNYHSYDGYDEPRVNIPMNGLDEEMISLALVSQNRSLIKYHKKIETWDRIPWSLRVSERPIDSIIRIYFKPFESHVLSLEQRAILRKVKVQYMDDAAVQFFQSNLISVQGSYFDKDVLLAEYNGQIINLEEVDDFTIERIKSFVDRSKTNVDLVAKFWFKHLLEWSHPAANALLVAGIFIAAYKWL